MGKNKYRTVKRPKNVDIEENTQFLDSDFQKFTIPCMYRTKLCDDFKIFGFCLERDKCTYAHGEDEIRQPGSKLSVKEYQKYIDS